MCIRDSHSTVALRNQNNVERTQRRCAQQPVDGLVEVGPNREIHLLLARDSKVIKVMAEGEVQEVSPFVGPYCYLRRIVVIGADKVSDFGIVRQRQLGR